MHIYIYFDIYLYTQMKSLNLWFMAQNLWGEGSSRSEACPSRIQSMNGSLGEEYQEAKGIICLR